MEGAPGVLLRSSEEPGLQVTFSFKKRNVVLCSEVRGWMEMARMGGDRNVVWIKGGGELVVVEWVGGGGGLRKPNKSRDTT
ncbi:hypothetical protein Pmani_035700 [Petrolisthes manimaculis]|uniref:Uncharacterized protein n=1 Tax=Petrolisthes manimaculis TaxID=1843537 RepID=A0AAE1NK17_9EUCA|nr:hypothetical protein Pmani_035700 [Petrolisthes manimaculis]